MNIPSVQEHFIAMLQDNISQLWYKFGILPSVAIGQAALESNWGRSSLVTHYNNLFGIKGSYEGNTAVMNTWEVYDGKRYDVKDGFRVYPDWITSILDYATFLTVNRRYHKAIGLSDYKQQIHAIHKAGYATDPDYASKVIRIIEQHELYELDEECIQLENKVAILEQEVKQLREKVFAMEKLQSMPAVASWAGPAVDYYVSQGLLSNPENLSYDLQRMITIMYRAGIGR